MLQGSQALRLLGSKALTGACKHPKHKHSEIHYMDYKTTPGPKSSNKNTPGPMDHLQYHPAYVLQLASNAYVHNLLPMLYCV